jgi:hypothetical protein
MAALLGAVPALGCGQILGVEGYRTEGPAGGDAGTGTAQAVLPLLPATPDGKFRVGCEACARTRCATQYTACRESEPCRQLLACHGRCSDPSCIARCRDTHAESFRFDDYLGCVFGGDYNVHDGPLPLCAGECGAGQNWGCAGVFHWDNSDYQSRETITLRFIDASTAAPGPLSTFAGAEAAPCGTRVQAGAFGGDQECFPWTPVDGQGRATIVRVGTQRTQIVAVRGGGQAARAYYQEAVRTNVPLLNRVAFDLTLSSRADYDSRAPLVSFQVYDCLSNPAVGTRVELGDPGAVRFYWTGWGLPDSTVETGNFGGFINVHASPTIKISAYLEGGMNPVSSKTILAAGDWVTSVMLPPRSAEQQL